MFKEADANKDGVLNEKEYKVFRQKDFEWTQETHGIALELDEEVFNQEYELMNKITPDKKGISEEDLFDGMSIAFATLYAQTLH